MGNCHKNKNHRHIITGLNTQYKPSNSTYGLYASYINDKFLATNTTSQGIGVYQRKNWGNLGGILHGNITHHDINSTRTLKLGDYQTTLEGRTNGRSILGSIELLYPIKTGKTTLTPYAKLQAESTTINALIEQSQSAAAITADAQKYHNTYGVVGANIHYEFSPMLSILANINYQNTLISSNPKQILRLNTLPDLPFYTPTYKNNQKAVHLMLGIKGHLGNITPYATATYQKSDTIHHSGVVAGISMSF